MICVFRMKRGVVTSRIYPILGDGAQGREDGHVACVQVLGDHEVAGVGTSEDDGQALWVEQIHESLALRDAERLGGASP